MTRHHNTGVLAAETRRATSHSTALTALLLAVSLSGCGYLQQVAPGTVTPKRGAALIDAPDLTTQPAQKVVNYYGQSFAGCMTFKEGLLSATAGVNVSADYLMLILNALGSVISPINVVHLLTAGASTAGGLKSTFANDVTSDNSVNLTIAFDKIYFQPMANLAQTTLSAGITTDNAPGIVSRIASLQAQCSLDEARAYINQNLTQGVAQDPTGQPLLVAKHAQ